jgi:hypothetical protein
VSGYLVVIGLSLLCGSFVLVLWKLAEFGARLVESEYRIWRRWRAR